MMMMLTSSYQMIAISYSVCSDLLSSLYVNGYPSLFDFLKYKTGQEMKNEVTLKRMCHWILSYQSLYNTFAPLSISVLGSSDKHCKMTGTIMTAGFMSEELSSGKAAFPIVLSKNNRSLFFL